MAVNSRKVTRQIKVVCSLLSSNASSLGTRIPFASYTFHMVLLSLAFGRHGELRISVRPLVC